MAQVSPHPVQTLRCQMTRAPALASWLVNACSRQNDITRLPQATAADGSLVRVGSAVLVRTKGGRDSALVRRIFSKSADGISVTYAHVHWLTSSYAGDAGELFLRAHHTPASPPCTNVKIASVRSILETRVRFVVDHAAATWRDTLPPGRHHPCATGSDPFDETVCDSCLSLEAERGRTPRAVMNTDGQPAGFTKDGETYHAGDLVFFAPEGILTGEAWTPGILARSNRQGEKMEWGVRVCGRYADLPDAGERFVDEVS